MTATRLGLFDGRLLTLFPRQLQNTAVSPTLLVKDKYARLIENIVPNTNKAGSGAKRFGLGKRGNALGENILDAFEYRRTDGTIQFIVYSEAGKLYTLNEGSGAYTPIKSGLSASGTVGALAFNGKLIFWNGQNRCFSWDGTSCADLGEWVSDVLSTEQSQSSTSRVTLKPGSGREDSDYPVGTQIRVSFVGGSRVEATVSATSYSSGSGVLTLDVTGTPFPSPNQAVTKIEYYAYPPSFSFMYAELDMLWGLSPGELKARVYRGSESMKVFFQAAKNNENSWYDYTGSTPTQDVPYINLANKAKVFDELVAISSKDGLMAFHGRKQLYLYAGDDPLTEGGFVWQKTIPVGTVHQKLIQHFPGDVLFVTPLGARSITRVFQTEQLEVTPDLGSDVDPTFQQKIANLLAGDTEYRKARSFFYERDGYYGFKLDDEGLPLYALSEESKGWTSFSGFFADASAFLGTTDGRLLVARGDQLYAYANGTDSVAGIDYSDDGEAITCKWFVPWIQANGRWSNRAFEILVEETESGTIYIDRFINFNTRNAVTAQADITAMGAEWDVSMWDEAEWDGAVVNPVVSDKFLCDNFSFMLRHSDTKGPRAILGVRPIGR